MKSPFMIIATSKGYSAATQAHVLHYVSTCPTSAPDQHGYQTQPWLSQRVSVFWSIFLCLMRRRQHKGIWYGKAAPNWVVFKPCCPTAHYCASRSEASLVTEKAVAICNVADVADGQAGQASGLHGRFLLATNHCYLWEIRHIYAQPRPKVFDPQKTGQQVVERMSDERWTIGSSLG